MLELFNICRRASGEVIADSISLQLASGVTNILLGPTLSGKTSLMRIMAGLDRPDSGDMYFNGTSVMGLPVQKRNVAMVYQQFINYPSLSVYDNIASPLKVAGADRGTIDTRVQEAASLLRIDNQLNKLPAELSGGQQQRVALARALAKRADLVLLDEPLANLDYKLREELRVELPQLFHSHGSVLVYATTEPLEALILDGHVAVMHEGRVVQDGPAGEVYREPVSLTSAGAFSDPPLNRVAAKMHGTTLTLADGGAAARPNLPDGDYTVGVRPHHVRLERRNAEDIEIAAEVVVNEITGSESFIHFNHAGERWVALVHGVRELDPGTAFSCYIDPGDFLYFDAATGSAMAAG